MSSIVRQKTVFCFSQAINVGVIYDATEIQDLNKVKQLVKVLKEDHKNVKTLGYVNDKTTKDFQQSRLGVDFFLNTDLNWHLKPENHIVENFISEEFDILIDLNMELALPLVYIACKSKAKFKVGRYDENCNEIYDLMLQIGKGADLNEFISQLKHYLTLINNTNAR